MRFSFRFLAPHSSTTHCKCKCIKQQRFQRRLQRELTASVSAFSLPVTMYLSTYTVHSGISSHVHVPLPHTHVPVLSCSAKAKLQLGERTSCFRSVPRICGVRASLQSALCMAREGKEVWSEIRTEDRPQKSRASRRDDNCNLSKLKMGHRGGWAS